MSFFDINKLAIDEESYSGSLSNRTPEVFQDLLSSKIESQKWCLGLDTLLTYHTDIGGILQKISEGVFINNAVVETDDPLDASYVTAEPNQAGFVLLPSNGPGWITSPSSPDRDRWGTPTVVQALVAIAAEWKRRGNTLPLVYGDISRQFGGPFPPHVTHQRGLDVDLWPVATRAGNHPVGSAAYSREKTRELIQLIRNNGIAQVDVIGFQDPVFVGEKLTRDWKGHRDHLHVRFK